MITPSLYEAITSYMDESDRHYQVDIEGGLIVTEITGDHGSWHVFIQITDDDVIRWVVRPPIDFRKSIGSRHK